MSTSESERLSQSDHATSFPTGVRDNDFSRPTMRNAGVESTREIAYPLSNLSNEKLILAAIKSFITTCILQHGMLPQQTVSPLGQYFSLHQATLRHMTYQVFENLYRDSLATTKRPDMRIVAALHQNLQEWRNKVSLEGCQWEDQFCACSELETAKMRASYYHVLYATHLPSLKYVLTSKMRVPKLFPPIRHDYSPDEELQHSVHLCLSAVRYGNQVLDTGLSQSLFGTSYGLVVFPFWLWLNTADLS